MTGLPAGGVGAAVGRHARLATVLALSVALVAVGPSCSGRALTEPHLAPELRTLTVTPDSLVVRAAPSVFSADSVHATARAEGAPPDAPGERVTWMSAAEHVAVASRSSGAIAGLQPGRTVIRAVAPDGRWGEAVVTVKEVDTSPIRIIAHRGFQLVLPENTLTAIDGAFELGADGVEIDVRLTRDRVPVVMHDESIDRTTNGSGRVSDLTWAYLRELDACSKFGPRWQPCHIPTFAEALRATRGRGLLVAHLYGAYGPEDVEALLDSIYAAGMERQTVITAFDLPLLGRFRSRDPFIAVGLLSSGPPWLDGAAVLGRAAIIPDLRVLAAMPDSGRGFAREARSRRIDVAAYTVRTQLEAQRLVAAGIRHLVSDIPLDKAALERLAPP